MNSTLKMGTELCGSESVQRTPQEGDCMDWVGETGVYCKMNPGQ